MAYAIVAVIVLIIDQASKYLTTLDIPLEGSVALIPGVIELTNIHNTGAAFGLLNDVVLARWLFIGLTIVLCAVIVVLLVKNTIRGKFGRWMLVLIMAGGLGNCIDRIINGYVTDMFNLQFVSFPVFNVADIFISVCGVLFIIYLIVSLIKGSKGAEYVEEPAVEDAAEKRGSRKAQTSEYEEKQASRQDYIAHFQQTTPAKAARQPMGEVRSWDDVDAELAAKQRANAVITPKAVTSQTAPVRPAAPAPAQRPTPAPAQRPTPAPAAAPKADTGEYKLEDILAEFSDK